MSNRRITAVSGTAIIGLVATLAIVGMTRPDGAGETLAADRSAADDGTSTAVEVQTVKPTRRAMTRTLRMPGTLLPGEMADLYAKTSGYVSSVRADIGHTVEKGQILLTIDVPEMADELRQAEAVHEAKKARAARAASMIQIARAEVGRAEAQHELSHISLERQKTLREGNAVPQQALDEATNKLAIADAQLAIARAKVGGAEADKVVAESEVGVAAATVARVRTLMGYATIKAPFEGVITERLVDPGAFVRSAAEGTTQPMLSISRVDFIRLALEIPESDAPWIRVGTKVEIVVKSLGDEMIEGTITRSAGSLKAATRTMRAEVDLPNKDRRLAPGMYAQVVIHLETKQQALMVPSRAIRVRGRAVSVLVAEGKTAESLPVKTGYDDGIWTEITEGLTGDEQIILSADSALKPGVAVRLANAAAMAPSD
jgi:HlyD family secretion protein